MSSDLSTIDSSLNFVLSNNGNKTIAVTGLNLTLKVQNNRECPEHHDRHEKMNAFEVYVQDFKPIAIQSNDVAALSLNLKSTSINDRNRFEKAIETDGKDTYGCMYLHVYTVAPIFGFDEYNYLIAKGYFNTDPKNIGSNNVSWTGNNGRPVLYRHNSRFY